MQYIRRRVHLRVYRFCRAVSLHSLIKCRKMADKCILYVCVWPFNSHRYHIKEKNAYKLLTMSRTKYSNGERCFYTLLSNVYTLLIISKLNCYQVIQSITKGGEEWLVRDLTELHYQAHPQYMCSLPASPWQWLQGLLTLMVTHQSQMVKM